MVDHRRADHRGRGMSFLKTMPDLSLRSVVAGFATALALLLSAQANAHMMVAQKGTVSIKGDNAFMVLSLPVCVLRRR